MITIIKIVIISVIFFVLLLIVTIAICMVLSKTEELFRNSEELFRNSEEPFLKELSKLQRDCASVKQNTNDCISSLLKGLGVKK